MSDGQKEQTPEPEAEKEQILPGTERPSPRMTMDSFDWVLPSEGAQDSDNGGNE
jgi:hypothetical protein